ncbi:MAG: hypothetical protein IPH69_03985 [Bacteroidales bacterium]|nr:hypothetical protein [Bacteroidales bacterium]
MLFRKIKSGLFQLPVVVFFIIAGLSEWSCFSQIPQTIDLSEIPQRKVRKYIEARDINHMQDFGLIHASWKEGLDESSFLFQEKTFFLKNKLSHVWDCYRKADPTKSWNGPFVRFGLLISKKSNSAVYSGNSTFPEIDTGQVYFLDLRIMRGLFNLPMAFEIINIDPLKRIIEFSYIDGNKSRGKQTIEFSDDLDGQIRIIHKSYFRSDSPFRDNMLYPYFHRKFIRQFHRNMKQLVQEAPVTI